MSEQKPIVATLVMKAGGMARQRIQLSARRNLDFLYRRGVGHVREYTDIETFHQEESALREIPRMPFNIRTVLGAVDDQAKVKGAIEALIGDDGGHRPTKHGKLCELRALLDAEIGRLEEAGVGETAEEAGEDAPPQPSAREMATERRRAFLRRIGEEQTRNIVRDYGLMVRTLNNYQGMMDAIIAREFPEEGRSSEAIQEEMSKPEQALAPKSDAGVDLAAMPMADLRKLAKERGIKGQSRREITEAFQAGAVSERGDASVR